MQTPNLKDVLTRAAARIRRDGMYKHQFSSLQDKDGLPVKQHEGPVRYCTAGAIRREIGIYNEDGSYTKAADRGVWAVWAPYYRVMDLIVTTCLPPGVTRLATWNDAPERTPEEVAAVLECAADKF